MNRQSTPSKDAATPSRGPVSDEGEEARRIQLVEVTIDSLAEVGYVGTTLAEIARRAGVSPGLVAHYFGDKDGLLEAAFRTLARSLAVRVRARLALAHTPRGRVQAVIDTNLAPEEFDKRSGTAWLAFWGQVLHVKGLKRVQTAYQRRMLSNLRSDLRQHDSGRGGAQPRGDDRRDDRRGVAARGALGMAGSRQRKRPGAAHGLRRGAPEGTAPRPLRPAPVP